VLGSNTFQSSDLPIKLKGISLVRPLENTDSVSKDSFPGQADAGAVVSSFAMENLKEQRKSESNIQIHPSFTHRADHGEEGIKPLTKAYGEKATTCRQCFSNKRRNRQQKPKTPLVQ